MSERNMGNGRSRFWKAVDVLVPASVIALVGIAWGVREEVKTIRSDLVAVQVVLSERKEMFDDRFEHILDDINKLDARVERLAEATRTP